MIIICPPIRVSIGQTTFVNDKISDIKELVNSGDYTPIWAIFRDFTKDRKASIWCQLSRLSPPINSHFKLIDKGRPWPWQYLSSLCISPSATVYLVSPQGLGCFRGGYWDIGVMGKFFHHISIVTIPNKNYWNIQTLYLLQLRHTFLSLSMPYFDNISQ